MRDTGKRAREIETHRGARGRCRDTDERKVEIGRHSEREKERLRDTVERKTESIWAVAPLMEVGWPSSSGRNCMFTLMLTLMFTLIFTLMLRIMFTLIFTLVFGSANTGKMNPRSPLWR